jgi:hypothetical protein
MEPLMMFAIPDCLRTRLRVRYLGIQQLGEDVNPINRIPLTVYPTNGQLRIDPVIALFASGEEVEGGREAAAFQNTGDTQQALLSQNHAIRGRVEELFATVRNNNESMLLRMQTLTRVVQRFANRPTQINHGFVRRRGGTMMMVSAITTLTINNRNSMQEHYVNIQKICIKFGKSTNSESKVGRRQKILV